MAKRSTIADPMPKAELRQRGVGFWLGLLATAVVAMGLFSCIGTNELRRTATDTGLEYQILRDGDGASPAADDVVLVHYEGSLADGTVFDSSYARGEPAAFGVGQVIPGFAEGLQLMQVGGKYRLFIPADLGYGATGAGDAIPPNSDLMFEVELIDIAPRDIAGPPAAATAPGDDEAVSEAGPDEAPAN